MIRLLKRRALASQVPESPEQLLPLFTRQYAISKHLSDPRIDHINGPPGSDLAVILSSGDVPDPAVSECLDAHGGVFLRKPFLPKALLKLVESELQSRRSVGRKTGDAPGSGA